MTDPMSLLARRPPGARRDDAAPTDDEVQLCAFFVGNEEYVLDIMRVEEILPPQRVIPIPHAPAFVEGVLHLRGAMLPVVDLRQRLLGQPTSESKRARMLVCRLGPRRVVVRVDRVAEVLRLRRRDIKPAPALMAAGRTPFVVGVCGPPERIRLLLDLKALLRAELERG
jgi:purine-binding chemotaxis protein CheW